MIAKMNLNGEDAASIKQDNGEGNHASTSDSQITDQDVDLGLTLPPSDLLFNTSCFAHDAAYSSKFAFPAQEGVIEESSRRELPRFHGIFDDDVYLEEPPTKTQRLTPENDTRPSQEDESVSSSISQNTSAKAIHQSSASNIQIRAPSIVSETGTHQSRSDSGYGTNIAESCESTEGVNDRLRENIQLPVFDAGLWGDDAQFDSFDAEFNLQHLDDNEDFTLINPKNITPPNPEPVQQQLNETPSAPPKADVAAPSFNLHLPLKGRRVNTATKVPKGFGTKKMSKAEVIKMGASAGLFPNSHQVVATTHPAISGEKKTPSPRNPQAQKSPTSVFDAQNVMDLQLPLAICTALTEPAMRPATLATIYRIQSAMLHDSERPSNPPPVKGSFLELLERFYQKFKTQKDLRETLITFILEKLEERAGEFIFRNVYFVHANHMSPIDDPETVRPTMKWMALENDLTAMEIAIKDSNDIKPEKQQLGLEAGSEILKRNADHIKELVAGMPHMKSLEARIRSQSKQIEALAAKCQELELQAQYRAAIAQAAKHTEALVPASVRMPPPLPSAFTPFEELPEDIVPQPHRIYRTSTPPVNTAWMCAHVDADSGEHCGAIMRSWIKHRQKGHELWISHITCVKCKQVHKSLAFKYFLHESEVQQLGGISRGRPKQDDSPKPQDDTPKPNPNPAEGNREPVQAATPSPELQQVDISAPSVSVAPTQAPAATHPIASEHSTRRSTQTLSTQPKLQKPTIPTPVQNPQAVSNNPAKHTSKAQPPAKLAEDPRKTALHPAVVDPRRGTASKPAAPRRPMNGAPQMDNRRAPSGRLNIPNPTFGRNARPAFSTHPQPLQQYVTAPYHQPPHHGQSYYLQAPQQGSYGYDQYHTPPPRGSPYPPQHRQQYHWTRQEYYGQTIQQSEYGPAPDRRFSSPSFTPQRQRPVSQAPQGNLGLPPTVGLGLVQVPPPAPTLPPAVLATPQAQTTKRLKRPLPTEADVIVLNPENPPSDDSQPSLAKRQCKTKPLKDPKTMAKTPPNPKPRTTSLAPIPKQTVDTLRSSMKLPEKSWMRDLPETAVVSDDEGEGASPSASQLIGEQAPGPPASQVAPPKKTRKRAKAALKVTAAKEAPAKKLKRKAKAAPKVFVSVEDLLAEESIVVAPAAPPSVVEKVLQEENVPRPLDHLYTSQNSSADADGETDSLFGDSEQDTNREMSDEMADEWAKELEAEMAMTPEVIETEEWGRELEAKMEMTPDVADESEEE
jgi:hypothetical protein